MANPKVSFKQQVLKAREEAIVASVNRLLADKGFDLMTMDEVAADVGIAKASLYKHFASKEALAAAAMNRILRRSMDYLTELEQPPGPVDPVERLKAVARWTMEVQLAGEMPSLPAQNSSLRAELMADADYMNLLMAVSEKLGEWIVQAQADGQLSQSLPPEVMLYTLFARACDPVLGVLKAGGHAHEQIIAWLIESCFSGLAQRA
ncbi:TetR/AcrR family transcriptional regulator [Aquabacterium sp.]|uniref:TetR/AcrR family transcriptional regulator n=1 Tax=Aquabacterium sp. TaxID=1872578 RepID=UPI002489AFF5|nr:TetR/AcrR family transcriptional regulator [Aquabacterium sp.]MDI1259956.1 TetR/AcrR family transcriptional regulator [Aquabacterium sp.]